MGDLPKIDPHAYGFAGQLQRLVEAANRSEDSVSLLSLGTHESNPEGAVVILRGRETVLMFRAWAIRNRVMDPEVSDGLSEAVGEKRHVDWRARALAAEGRITWHDRRGDMTDVQRVGGPHPEHDAHWLNTEYRCTCGSGAHPRQCSRHPMGFRLHVAEWNAELALQDEHDEEAADWLATMAEECARQADTAEADVITSADMLMRMGEEAMVFNRLHDEALRERDQLRKDIAHLTQQAGEDSCADQVRRRIEAEAERDAAMLYHARDWAITERLVNLNEGARMADGLRELYPEHADRLLTKDNP